MSDFEAADLRHLEEVGITPAEARRQLRLLRHPPPPLRLVRPCTLGDGIVELPRERSSDLHRRLEDALARRSMVKLVPASGAATRMFQALLARDGGAVRRFLAAVDAFPFHTELEQALARRGLSLGELASSHQAEPILRALLDDDGLGFASLPKALVPFHRYGAVSHTPLEEHLRETAVLGRGAVRFHATVAPDVRPKIEHLVPELLARLRDDLGTELSVELSEQASSTDTLAVDLDGIPVRDQSGRLLLRPGGHGALLRNLAALDADVVLVKNIDNVLPGPRQAETVEVEALLFGELLRLEERQHQLQRRLRETSAPGSDDLDAARTLLCEELGRPDSAAHDGPAESLRESLLRELERPIRVCGVVRNTGEPGGGPFWVADSDGSVTPQIVESSQIDSDDDTQTAIARRSTHFNPVLLVGSLRDDRGEGYDLERFVDDRTSFVSRKSADGTELFALERPGLWNGSMAGWCTVFVEIPGTTFAPVKTVFDLLRDEHREV